MFALKYCAYILLFIAPTIRGYRTLKHNGAAIILARSGETIDILCQDEVPLVRCGFTHPNGTKILSVNVVPGTPYCKFTTDATTSEVGLWTCHLWTPTSPQEEIQKTVEVRIADKFAALDREVAVKEGGSVTLSCASSEGMVPLNECHFTSPEQLRIHVDDKITEEHMVLNKYFFPANQSVHRGDCSLTISSVSMSDAGTWACYSWLELENRQYTGTILLKVEGVYDIIDDAFRVFNVNGAVTILALENEPISIQCEQDIPMAYCGFQHPSGKRFSFSGNELNDGHCAIPINVTKQDAGEWRCHIGKTLTGVELMQRIQLRVVDKVAAIRSNITAVHGKYVTIECATTEGYLPLSYCRFEPPNDIPFSIDSAVNYSSPILGRYFFPANKSLDRGDCAVTVRKVQYEDVGTWTCGGGLSDGKEYTDSVKLIVEGLYTMSTASATGVTFGALGIGAFLIILAYVGWKKRRFLGAGIRNPEAGHEMGEMPQSRRSSASRRSPQASRVPTVVVQSPSEPGRSPLM